MITVKDLMQCKTQSSPDGKHWEPAIPDGSLMSWRVRLQDALAVWRGEAIAIRQTTKADISKDYTEREACAKVCDEQVRRSLASEDKAQAVLDQKIYNGAAHLLVTLRDAEGDDGLFRRRTEPPARRSVRAVPAQRHGE